MFNHTHLTDLISLWRTSPAQQSWIREPSDPNQAEDEYEILHSAVYHSVIIGYIDYRRKSQPAQEVGNLKIRANKIIDYMTDCATNNPRAKVFLSQIRFLEVIWMLKKAEKEGNSILFNSGMKFSLMLYASSNAFKYVSMVLNFIFENHLSSEAELKLLEKILFRKTKNGSTIYMDRSVEWAMRVVRSFLGKFYTMATDSRFNSMISVWNRNEGCMTKSTSSKQSTAPKPTTESTRVEVEFNSIYLEVLVYLAESRIWHLDEPQLSVAAIPFKKRERRRNNARVNQRLDDLNPLPNSVLTKFTNDTPLRTDVCFILSNSRDKIRCRFDEVKNNRYSKNTVSFEALKCADEKEESKFILALRSTSLKEVKKVSGYTKKHLIAEILRHLTKLAKTEVEIATIQTSISKSSVSREKLIDTAIPFRNDRIRALSQSNTSDAAASISQWNRIAIEEHYSRSDPADDNNEQLLSERLNEELKDKFYTLQCPLKDAAGELEYTFRDGNDDRASRSDQEGSVDGDSSSGIYSYDSNDL